jgi:hypothetical protein
MDEKTTPDSSSGAHLPPQPTPSSSQEEVGLNRKGRRTLIAQERRRMALGRKFPSGNWIPRPHDARYWRNKTNEARETARRKLVRLESLKTALLGNKNE